MVVWSLNGYNMMMKCLKALGLFIILAALGLGCYFAWVYHGLVKQPMVARGARPEIFTVDKSMSAMRFAQRLSAQDLISHPQFFIYLMRYQGLSSRIKAGIYEIHPGESADAFLRRVVAGDVLTKNVTIVEGTTLTQVEQTLKQSPFLEFNNTPWNKIAGNHLNAEGLLLAETYRYDAGSTAEQVLNQAHKNLLTQLEAIWASRDEQLPYKSSYDLLIAASIIEKETAQTNEQNLVSSVIVNRLRLNMPLQMDPTVIYGLGTQYKGNLTRADLRVLSPYNTYLHYGLPPTPIAMVGKAALNAAAHPDKTQYLFYVAKGDGSHVFSTNYQQQLQAIKKYQRKD